MINTKPFGIIIVPSGDAVRFKCGVDLYKHGMLLTLIQITGKGGIYKLANVHLGWVNTIEKAARGGIPASTLLLVEGVRFITKLVSF